MSAKRIRFFLISVCLALVFIAMPCIASSAPIILKYGGLSPEGSAPEIHANKVWRDDIKKATGGRVTFEEYYAQTLFKAPDAYRETLISVNRYTWPTNI